jgi:phosphoglycolate phosphatase
MAGFPRSLSDATTVYCDFDGPVVDVSDRYYSTYCLALTDTAQFYREFSSQERAEESLLRDIHFLSKSRFWEMKQNRVPDREIATQSGLREEEMDFFIKRVLKIVNCADLLQQDKIQPGASRALNMLHSQGFKLVLVTLRDRTEATEMLEAQGLRRLFTGIYGTENRHQAAYKNYADIKTGLLARAIDELASEGGDRRAWAIGDTEADILAGKAMQIATIGLTCGIRSHQQLDRLQPTRIEIDLLAAARYLVEINTPQLCGRAM